VSSPDPGSVLDQAGRERHGDDQGDAGLIECSGNRLQQAAGVGKGVRSAEAGEYHSESEAVIERQHNGLEGDRPAELEVGRP
jgi:hypothetical protein